jgi:carboxyl-terminal processing protease
MVMMKKRIGMLIATVFLFSFLAVYFVRAEQEEAKEKKTEEKETEEKETEEKEAVEQNKELFKQIQLLSDSMALISTDYVEAVSAKDLIYGALRGMTGTLDGYSQFLDQESFREITEETKGEFGGVGIEIGVRDGILTVISPMEDSPAFKAGVKAGDMIVKINDETTRDMTLDDAVKMLRGDAGTKLKISVIREELDRVLDFELTRAIIKLQSVKEAKILEEDIAYVKLVEFQERTPEDMRKALDALVEQGARSLVLDMRNNPGGLLDSAVGLAELFLDEGKLIVYTQGRDPEKKVEYRVKKKPEFPVLDMVVLVNKGSASASEIMAGAIKDNKRGLVVGVTTFGKGSVQTVIPLMDKTALRLTTASYFTPSGKTLRNKGIDPDIFVEYRPKREKVKEEESQKKSKVFSALEEKEKGVPEKGREKDLAEKTKESGKENQGEEKKEGEEDVEIEKPSYDSQLEAAVNILKGLKIVEGYKDVVVPAKE